ncbi:MAG: alpha/beta hydrolase [Tannerellaceae bacterium]
MDTKEYYTFTLSDKVKRQHVHYKNRYGITISADMYISKELDIAKKHAALVIGTPHGGVKEQGAGIYAQTMAERGFVTIAFDESYNGESGGEPRHVSSPDIFTEDFCAGVDFLGTLTFVDRERIGAIGICGSGGFALTATQVDKRIKAVATTSQMAQINFPLMEYIGLISPRPILFVMGEKAHSRYFTEDAYKKASQPKELVIVPGARHIDLYDRTDMIPFDKLESFFKEHLK